MKARQITTTLALMLLAAAASYSITLSVCSQSFNSKLGDLDSLVSQHQKIAEVQNCIEKYYVNSYDKNQVADGAAAGMVAYLGDRWSYYLNKEQFAAYRQSIENTLVGIGVNVTQDSETGGILVIDVYANSPAERAGIQAQDLIIGVDGKTVQSLGYEGTVHAVQGKAGTTVKLTCRDKAGKVKDVSITREKITVESVKSQILPGNIGYIRIRGFDLNVDQQFIEAVRNLQAAKVSGFIFDVRNNPGGALQTLVNSLDILLPEGLIISEKDKNGNEQEYTSDANEVTKPMVVLVNEYSISAAEFFAASLQEYNKATIIGTPTTGKGCAQSPIELSDGSGLILSISKYYTASGISLAETKGIKPDVVVTLTDEEIRQNYKRPITEDRQVQAALSKLGVKSVA